MNKLKVINSDMVLKLTDEVKSPSNKSELIERYKNGDPFIFKEEDLIETSIMFNAEEILNKLDSDSELRDYNSSKAIFLSLKNIPIRAAADKRLWATLTHRELWPYISKRWQFMDDEDKAINNIHQHWLFKFSDRTAFTRNAISRLWWAAYLTYAPWEKEDSLKIFQDSNPFKYTEIMTGLSQLWFDVTEREWGGSLIYRICFLETYNRIINSKDISDKTGFSNELAKWFTGVLVPDIIIASKKDPLSLVEYVEELTDNFI